MRPCPGVEPAVFGYAAATYVPKKSQEWTVAFLDKFVKTVKEKEASF
ncbi:MAG: hypothetical protein WBH03_12105 [Cyclobacteriaceae bacterium]